MTLGSQSRGERQRALGAIHDIEVVAGGALGEQVADLIQGPVNADDFDDVGIFRGDFKAAEQRGREGGATQRGEALDLLQGKHGHDTRHDWHRDATGMAFLHEAVIRSVVEKKLGRDERRAGIHFALQIFEIGFRR